MSEGEIWRDVVGYEGLYKVSDRGNVYSVERMGTNGRKYGGRALKPGYRRDGYLQVHLCENGMRKGKLIHRLVLEAFVENPNNLPEVNHIDEIKDNNELSNLEWCDSSYNNKYGTKNERIAQKLSKKVKAVNVGNGEVFTFSSVKEAVNKGYSRSNVTRACGGVYKNTNGELIGGDGRTYRGHRWTYIEEGV